MNPLGFEMIFQFFPTINVKIPYLGSLFITDAMLETRSEYCGVPILHFRVLPLPVRIDIKPIVSCILPYCCSLCPCIVELLNNV